MKHDTNIYNIETLEREIYRLKLEAKNRGEKLEANADYLQKNFAKLVMNSFSCRQKSKENGKKNFFKSTFSNEKMHAFVDKMVDRFSDRAADSMEHLFNKMFHKKK